MLSTVFQSVLEQLRSQESRVKALEEKEQQDQRKQEELCARLERCERELEKENKDTKLQQLLDQRQEEMARKQQEAQSTTASLLGALESKCEDIREILKVSNIFFDWTGMPIERERERERRTPPSNQTPNARSKRAQKLLRSWRKSLPANSVGEVEVGGGGDLRTQREQHRRLSAFSVAMEVQPPAIAISIEDAHDQISRAVGALSPDPSSTLRRPSVTTGANAYGAEPTTCTVTSGSAGLGAGGLDVTALSKLTEDVATLSRRLDTVEKVSGQSMPLETKLQSLTAQVTELALGVRDSVLKVI